MVARLPHKPQLWDLPEVVVYHVVSFLAPPTCRASVLCHQIAVLCKSAYHGILVDLERSAVLWDAVLMNDYCVTGGLASNTRSSKRLRRSSVQRVMDAHQLMRDNTEICYFFVSELANSAHKDRLTRPKLSRLLNEYGPNLRVNSAVSSGGLFIVELCRARNVQESTILRCIQELVEERGALINLSTHEPPSSLTALAVASARGMPTVVKYLLSKSADRSIRSSGRFRLHTNAKKTLRCSDATPLEFAQAMFDAEVKEGAQHANLSDLARCIQLLKGKA